MAKSILDGLMEEQSKYRTHFLLKKNEIMEAQRAGFSLRKIWMEMSKHEDFNISYDMFRRYCRKNLPNEQGNEQHSTITETSKAFHLEASDSKNTEKQLNDSAKTTEQIPRSEPEPFIKGFQYNRKKDPSELF